MSEQEEDKFFVTVKGGSDEEREKIKGVFKGISDKDAVDIDLLNVKGVEEDLSVIIKTKCGEVELSGEDLKKSDNILETACGKVKCPVNPPELTEEEPVEEVAEEDVVEGDTGNED